MFPSVDDCKVMRFLKRLSGKKPQKQSRSGKKIEAENAVPILLYLYIVIMVHKYRQSAKENCSLKRNTVAEVFPLTIGSGKTMPFEKRHAGCEEREKINRRRIFDTSRINFFEATKQTACIFSKGEETGVNYYGARYLDPKYSRWLSGDPALGDYIPKAPIDDEAKKHNENLPGMGGVFNVVNLHLYHYAGNNPVKYTDPDGRDIISFFQGWVNYNLNNAISSRYGSQYAYNPQFEMANEVLANIGQIMKNGYSVYVQTLKFTSEHSGTATLFLLTIGQPGLAAITSTIGLAADSLLVIDNFANGNIVEGSKGIAVIGLSMLANNGVKKGFEKLGSLVGISVGKNGLYYMKGRRGALKTIDGIRKQLYKDLVEGYFGQAIAPEVASQMVDAVMKEILKTEKVEE